MQSPITTLVPVEPIGQLAATQLLEKYGLDVVALNTPLKPASHAQSPVGTFVPVEGDGQSTATGTVVTYAVAAFAVGMKSAETDSTFRNSIPAHLAINLSSPVVNVLLAECTTESS